VLGLGAVLDHEEPLPHPASDQAQSRLYWVMSAFGGILLQNFQKAVRLISRKETKRAAISEGRLIQAVTEVACEFVTG
jgi:hypothetical protein